MWREDGHLLKVGELGEVWEFKPEKLIGGDGAYGRMKVSQEVKSKAKKEGIKLIIKKSGKACKIYNNCDKKKTVLAVHLTC